MMPNMWESTKLYIGDQILWAPVVIYHGTAYVFNYGYDDIQKCDAVRETLMDSVTVCMREPSFYINFQPLRAIKSVARTPRGHWFLMNVERKRD
jgi:hypothetical protein